jgi:putative oxidoreductase
MIVPLRQEETMDRPRWQVYVGHGLAVLAALSIGGAGAAKLASTPDLVANFARWGYAPWFVYLAGALEVLGAVLVVVPRTRVAGAALLVVVMLGAVATHLRAGEAAEIVAPLVLGTMAAGAGALALRR